MGAVLVPALRADVVLMQAMDPRSHPFATAWLWLCTESCQGVILHTVQELTRLAIKAM